MFHWNEFIEDINNTLKDGEVVLDAGAGDGHWKGHLLKKVEYIGMDLGVGDSNVDYSKLDIKGDLRKIPLPDNKVDIIICIQVLEHVPEPWNVLNEFNRVLKVGGTLFLSCPQGVPLHQEPYDFYRYTKYGLTHLFTSNGFTITWIKPQKGSFSKIANDLRMSAIELIRDKNRAKAFFLKLMARAVDFLFKKENNIYFTDTTGYFIKATKKL